MGGDRRRHEAVKASASHARRRMAVEDTSGGSVHEQNRRRWDYRSRVDHSRGQQDTGSKRRDSTAGLEITTKCPRSSMPDSPARFRSLQTRRRR